MPQDYTVCKYRRTNQLKRLKIAIYLFGSHKTTTSNSYIALCSELSGCSTSTVRRYLKSGKIPNSFFNSIATGLCEIDKSEALKGKKTYLARWLIAGYKDSRSVGEDCWTLYYRIMLAIDKTSADIASHAVKAGLKRSISLYNKTKNNPS